jgi:hypothetical protein
MGTAKAEKKTILFLEREEASHRKRESQNNSERGDQKCPYYWFFCFDLKKKPIERIVKPPTIEGVDSEGIGPR